MPNQTPSGPRPATAAVLSFLVAGEEQSRLAPQWLSGAGDAAEGVCLALCGTLSECVAALLAGVYFEISLPFYR